MTEVKSTGNHDLKQDYRREIGKKTLFIGGSLVSLVVLVILSCAVGTGYGFFETYQIIVDRLMGVEPSNITEWWADHYVCENILPGIVAAIIAGAGLSLGGAVMQSMMGNPLADPYTTGISSGACFGAVLSITMGLSFGTMTGDVGIVAMAFVGALIPSILIILLSRFVNSSPSTLILIGTAISYFFNALVTYVMVISDADALQDAFTWQIGAVSDIHWGDLPLMLIVVSISSVLILLVSNKLNLMMMGDDSAKTLGLDVDNFRTLCLVLISVLIASIISFTGIIGFVGLIAPHITRYIIGGDNKFVIPAGMLMGAIILCLADLLSRCLLDFGNVPIGVVMSFIGAPIFLYLIVRSKSDKEVF
ncbi:MAG: iron ABC transporter permease [Candidatus Methanomethylophilaceae archaeon]|nr:iron ABC transporter permease [Candidatus Methanomethylophilaceae archaeon]